VSLTVRPELRRRREWDFTGKLEVDVTVKRGPVLPRSVGFDVLGREAQGKLRVQYLFLGEAPRLIVDLHDPSGTPAVIVALRVGLQLAFTHGKVK